MSSRGTMQFCLWSDGDTPKVETYEHQGALLITLEDDQGRFCISGQPERVRTLLRALVDAAESIPIPGAAAPKAEAETSDVD